MLPAQEETSLHLHGTQGVTEKIKKAMYNAAREFVYIGFLLWEVHAYGYYKEAGYKDVYEYTEKEIGLKKSSTKNLIAIADKFGRKENELNPSMTLQPKYEQFNYSQLTEMLSMSVPQRDKVTPDMTIKQIRAIKKDPKFALKPEAETMKLPLPDDDQADTAETGQTSGQSEKSELKAVAINNYWRYLPPEVIKEIVKAGGLRYNPKSCYNITVELDRD